ncbi:diguanylate cyclase, partial [Bradyrhizobium sp. NBAIM08]|uniref:diguanylate cyclase n=1 Tax=Bradyrhizobium sp. NBAIM08 TaxID=2793815 RepID=UPI001CD598FF
MVPGQRLPGHLDRRLAVCLRDLEHAATALRPGRSLAVLLVDLDGFKLLNDALGHDVGDQ